MRFEAFEKIISALIDADLSGLPAQMQMAPPFRDVLIQRQKLEGNRVKKAGVLALLYPDFEENINMVFIVRKSYDGVHSGQIGFPGGKPEAEDGSLAQTAIRETWEEIGVKQSLIQIIKPLTDLYIPPSNFNVSPFLAVIKSTPKFNIQPSEVQSIIEVSLNDILDKKNLISTLVKTSYGPSVQVPAFLFKGQIVWGATAMILMEIVVLLRTVLKK